MRLCDSLQQLSEEHSPIRCSTVHLNYVTLTYFTAVNALRTKREGVRTFRVNLFVFTFRTRKTTKSLQNQAVGITGQRLPEASAVFLGYG